MCHQVKSSLCNLLCPGIVAILVFFSIPLYGQDAPESSEVKSSEFFNPSFGVLDPSIKPEILISSPGFAKGESIIVEKQEGIFEIWISTFSPISSIDVKRIEKKIKLSPAIAIQQPSSDEISVTDIEESEDLFEEELSSIPKPIAITYKSKTPTGLILAVPYKLIHNKQTGRFQEHFQIVVDTELGRKIENFIILNRDRSTEIIPIFNPLPEGILLLPRKIPDASDDSLARLSGFEPDIQIISPTFGDTPVVNNATGRYRFFPGVSMRSLQGEQEIMLDVEITTLSKILNVTVTKGFDERHFVEVKSGTKFGFKQEQPTDTLAKLMIPVDLKYNSGFDHYSAFIKVTVKTELGTGEKIFPLIEAGREDDENFQFSLISGFQNFKNVNKATGAQIKTAGTALFYIFYPRYDIPSSYSENSIYRLSYLHSGKNFSGDNFDLKEAETTLNQVSLSWKNIETRFLDFEVATGLNEITKRSEYSLQGTAKGESNSFLSGTMRRLIAGPLRMSLHYEVKNRVLHDETIRESYKEDGIVTTVTPMISFTTPENSGKLYTSSIQNEASGMYKKSTIQEIGLGYNYLMGRHIIGASYSSRLEKFIEMDPWYNERIETNLSRFSLKETYRQSKSFRYMFEIISESEASNVDDPYSDTIIILSFGWKVKTVL